jgi:general secretion pathway protein K
VQIESAERARTQSAWILSGALDWARLILREDARNGGSDHLGEPWAVPLAEARLSSFLAADKDNTDDAPEAFLSGVITDAQARYNLTNLVDQGKPVAAQVAALARLCRTLGLPDDTASRIADGLVQAQSAAQGRLDSDAPLKPQSPEQLVWLGADAQVQRALSPHVVVLPVATPVNLNTAGREVLSAVIKGLDLTGAERLIEARKRQPFTTLQDAQALLTALPPLDVNTVNVTTSYFEVRGRLRLEARVMEQVSLVERKGLDVSVLQTRRVAHNEGENP